MPPPPAFPACAPRRAAGAALWAGYCPAYPQGSTCPASTFQMLAFAIRSGGNGPTSTDVITTCPPPPTWRSRAPRRSRSSSDRTSSSRSTGRSPVRLATSSASASFRLTTAVRCCPCEPYPRASWPPSSSRRSSRCGPMLVVPLRKSSASELCTAAAMSSGGPRYSIWRRSPAPISAWRRAASGASSLTAPALASTTSVPTRTSSAFHTSSSSVPASPAAMRFSKLLRCSRIRRRPERARGQPAHQLHLAASPGRSGQGQHRHRFQQVGLALTVGAQEYIDPRLHRDVEVGVVAMIPELQSPEQHAGLGHRHPHGHDHVEVVLLARRSQHAGAERAVEHELDLVLADHAQRIEHVAGVESDLDVGPVNVGHHLCLAVAHFVGGGGQRERSGLRLDADDVGAVAGKQRDGTYGLGELCRGDLDLGRALAGDNLCVVGILSVDQAGSQLRAPGLEEDLVAGLGDDHLDPARLTFQHP